MTSDEPLKAEREPAVAATPTEAREPYGDARCPECDYSLRGLTSGRCPECGYLLGAAALTASQIPWVHRKQIGRFRAYWKTVWMVMFRTKRFCEEFGRPVSYRHSQSFRWVTILLAYLPLLAVNVVAFGAMGSSLWSSVASLKFVAMILWPLTFPACLAAMTGVPSYFFHPRRLPVEQQNAAVAMSYYTCAPLAWTAAVFVVAGLGAVLASLVEAVGLAFFLLAALLPFALLAVWWLDLIHVAHRTLRRRAIALVSFAVAVPVLWLVVAALILVGIPLAFFLVALVVSSLS